MKALVRQLVPPLLLRWLARGGPAAVEYGPECRDWAAARAQCTGYEAPGILERVREATHALRRGAAAGERDSILFDRPQYSYPILSAILRESIITGGRLEVMDFGGSLGSTYYNSKWFIDSIKELTWNVIEQEHFCEVGRREFQDDRLRFFPNLASAGAARPGRVLLLSSVLQYLESPWTFLEQARALPFQLLIFETTTFWQDDGPDRICLQRVRPPIYDASYPVWVFRRSSFLDRLEVEWRLIAEWQPFPSMPVGGRFLDYRGFIFERRKTAIATGGHGCRADGLN